MTGIYMSILNKQQYENRAISAAHRNADNYEIAISNGMTEEQAGLIVELCSLRHEFHSNLDAIVVSDETGMKQSFVELNCKLNDAGIPMPFVGTDESDFIDIDSLLDMEEYGEEYDRDEEYSRIYSELEQFNTNVESYLKNIDKKYNTCFCPTGTQRAMI